MAVIDDNITNKYSNPNIVPLILQQGPFSETESSAPETFERLRSVKVLVLGAGGLGCELLKNLAYSGFKCVHVIDMDTIDLSNLNRQFLFRSSDIGKPKAIVAADFINMKMGWSGVNVVPHYCRLESLDDDFYKQFNVVISGLDSIEARRWINSKLVDIAVRTHYETIIPLIDGGTEGFSGQTKVILPTLSACYECSVDTIPPKKRFPMCTIANNPRLPEHCVEYVLAVAWSEKFDYKIDGDDPKHINWIYEKSQQRAQEFNISGVTRSLVLGVTKNIIPSIASTNAIIAASCVNETFKFVTECNPMLDNFMLYNGSESVFTFTYSHERNPACTVCSGV